jgi:hypothetical protein
LPKAILEFKFSLRFHVAVRFKGYLAFKPRRVSAKGVLLVPKSQDEGASAKVSPEELTELDRQWATIKAGEPTVAHEDVVRWLDTWGTPDFRSWQGR